MVRRDGRDYEEKRREGKGQVEKKGATSDMRESPRKGRKSLIKEVKEGGRGSEGRKSPYGEGRSHRERKGAGGG